MSLLRVSEVSKRFGGVRAVDRVSFDVDEGGVVGIIGPNGAGKTSLFNLLSGLQRCDEGTITFAGTDITRMGPPARARRGIGRTFQVARPFVGMSVAENVMVPLMVHERRAGAAHQEAMDVLESLSIAHLADTDAVNLTLAQRKRVEVARAVATKPRLLLLDEVLAGLNTREVDDALPFVGALRERGITVLMIEHLVSALMSVSDRVLVLDQGTLIASGAPGEVRKDPAVIKAYLGEETTDAQG